MIKFKTLAEAENYDKLVCDCMREKVGKDWIAENWSVPEEKDGEFYMEEHPDYEHGGEVVTPVIEENQEVEL